LSEDKILETLSILCVRSFRLRISDSDFRFPIDEQGRRAEINSDHTFGILLVLGGFIMTDHRKSGS